MMRRVTFLLAGAALAASSSAQNYAQKTQTIRAGIVLIESSRTLSVPQPRSTSPHAFFNLDSAKDIKPGGWSLVNPLAPSQFTVEAATRWTAIHTATGIPGAPIAGQRVTKRQAAYWEVNLGSVSDSAIQSYDLLLLAPFGPLSLSPAERERLRKFVDGGGTLWVDLAGVPSTANFDQTNALPVGMRIQNELTDGIPQSSFFHPLLRNPFSLSAREVTSLLPVGRYSIQQADVNLAGGATVAPLFDALRAEFSLFEPVVFNSDRMTISVARIGDGFMVVTSRGASIALNRTLPEAGNPENQGSTGLEPKLEGNGSAAARFAVNLISLAGESRQAGVGARRSGANSVDISAPLLRRFSQAVPTDFGTQPPAIYKGLAYVSVGNQVVAYDLNPSSDLDGDGDPDDGEPDFAQGIDVDVVWVSAPMAGPISSPVAAEVEGLARILVADQNGTIHGFEALPRLPNGRLSNVASVAYSTPPPATGGAAQYGGAQPFPVTVHERTAFVTDLTRPATTVGRVWQLDVATGQRLSETGDFVLGGSFGDPVPEFANSATVGYLPIAAGGADRVLYVPTRATGLGNPAGLQSYWIGARGESPVAVRRDGSGLVLSTRASRRALHVVVNPSQAIQAISRPRLTVLDPTGRTLTAAEMAAFFTGTVSPGPNPGEVQFGLSGGAPANFADTYGFRLDYTIDWSQPNKQQVLRGRLQFPDVSASRQVLGNLALSRNGVLFAVTGNRTRGGSLFALRESPNQPGLFQLMYRYELYQQHRVLLNQTQTNTVPNLLPDNDQLQTFAPGFLGGPLNTVAFQGGPVIRGRLVFVNASATKGGFGVPAGVVMAFDSDPAVREIRLKDLPNGSLIEQPDLARSSDLTQPETRSQFSNVRYVWEKQPGSPTGVLRFPTLMANNNGQIVQSLSVSQPIVIRRPGQPDYLVEPDREGGRWNPLQWYMVLHGARMATQPVVTGGTLFWGGSSSLPNILDSGTFGESGIIGAINGDMSVTDPFVVSDTNRPWMRQAWQLKNLGGGNIQSNPNVLWPQGSGLTSFSDWVVRLNQTVLSQSPRTIGLAAGDGSLLAWGLSRLYCFSRADFLVADEGRLARFDPSGNPIWQATNYAAAGPNDVGFATTLQNILRPTRAYRLDQNDLLVVDTGGNKVVRLTTTGGSLRSINGFRLDPNVVPDGFRTNDPLNLNGPRDVTAYTSVRQITGAVGDPVTRGDGNPVFELWTHYLIADGGNRRLVEVIDRNVYDPVTNRVGDAVRVNGQPQLGVLLWHSPSTVSGKNFDYNSVSRVYLPSGGGRWVYVAGVGNSNPTRADTGLDAPSVNPLGGRESSAGNGGVVIFDPNNPAGAEVINEIVVDAIPNNVLWNEAANSFTAPGIPGRTKLLSGVTSVTAKVIPNGTDTLIALMIADTTGVYEVIRPVATSGWVTRWMLPSEAYRAMRRVGIGSTALNATNPLGFRPTYARRLDSNEVLIVNGYTGRLRGFKQLDGSFLGQLAFLGEVLQVDGDIDPVGFGNATSFGYSPNKTNLGFRAASVRFELPPIQNTRGLVAPVFADRR